MIVGTIVGLAVLVGETGVAVELFTVAVEAASLGVAAVAVMVIAVVAPEAGVEAAVGFTGASHPVTVSTPISTIKRCVRSINIPPPHG